MTRNLPEEFTTYTRQLMGDSLFGQLMDGINSEAVPTSIRLNPFKIPQGTYALQQEENVPWCPLCGRYLSERPNFTFDPLFHAGLYYAQEASSMMVDLAVRQLIHQPITMLDLCAAPGGKSTALRAALPEGSLLVSNEPMRTRAQILAENIQKFGHQDVIVTNNYPRDFRRAGILFDAILADVPCSGEGMFRKDEGAIAEWSAQNVRQCAQLQRDIITDIWPCLKPGGLLIYSTCTFNAHEDEENVAWIANETGAEHIRLDIDPAWGITGNLTENSEEAFPVYRFLPGKTKGEGLFMAILHKRDDDNNTLPSASHTAKNRKNDRKAKGKRDNTSTSLPQGWLDGNAADWQAADLGGTLCAIPTRWLPIYQKAADTLKVLHSGIQVGTMKGKDFIPAHGLALSLHLQKGHFPRVELSYPDALRFLRKEAVNLPEGTPCGYVLVTYRGIPLGWEKNIGNRANNLYPQEWKIKSAHVPQEDSPVIAWQKN